MIARTTTWILSAAFACLLFPACRKDPAIKATKTECEDVCEHMTAVSGGKKGYLVRQCPTICIDKSWTVGDVRCIADAPTMDEVKNCGAVAKYILRASRKHKKPKQSHKKRHKKSDAKPQPDED